MKNCCTLLLLIWVTLPGLGQASNDTIPGQPLREIRIVKEPRFLLNVHSGYSIGLGSTFKFYPDDVSSINVSQDGNNAQAKTVSYSNPTKGLGDGFKFGGGLTYIMNDFISPGIDFDYFHSTIRKTRDSNFRQTNIVGGPNLIDEYQYNERNIISYDATLLSLTPFITFKAISKPKWFLYNKIGAIITFRPNSLQKDITNINTRKGWQGFYQDSTSTIEKKYEWGIRNPAWGFMGGVGAQVRLNNKFRAYLEAQFSHIVFVIRKRTLTDFIIDDNHIENSLPRSMRELDFVKSYSSNAGTASPDMPSQTVIQRIPISYLGVQAGVVFTLK